MKAENIGKLLQFLKKNGKDHIAEIIVCDAKSEDETVSIANKSGAETIFL